MATSNPHSDPNSRPKRHRFSLLSVLALSFGGLVAASVGLVLYLTIQVNLYSTFSLLNDRAITLLETMDRSIRNETDEAERFVSGLAEVFAGGGFELNDMDTQREILRGMLMSSNVVEGLFINDFDGNRTGLGKIGDGSIEQITAVENISSDGTRAFIENVVVPAERPVWGEPVIVRDVQYHNVLMPLKRNGRTEGIVVATMGRNTMNRVISELGDGADATVFLLTADNVVVGHSQKGDLFAENPIIYVKDFPDEVLKGLSNAMPADEFERARESGINVFETDDGPTGHIYVTKQIAGYSALPYTLGVYFRKAEIGTAVIRALFAMIAGLVALVVALIMALMIGRRLSRPMVDIAKTAKQFSNFEIDRIEPLPHSRIREIDDQANALNALRHALEEFSRYVPRSLVKRILTHGHDATGSQDREVTIMFTDIVGFTSLSETMDAQLTAETLNDHFSLICCTIEDHFGTVDKFMGDSVMAFWGAPEVDTKHAENAVLAAKEIAGAIHQKNLQRVADGLPAIRVRIGLHTGRAIVGNIGGGDRQNYTVMGDSVNVAQRLEELGREIIGDHDSIVLVSSATREQAGEECEFSSVGSWSLRGREQAVQVHALVAEGAATPENVLRFPIIKADNI